MPASVGGWSEVTNFQVAYNELAGGPLPVLPFATLSCYLLGRQSEGEKNAFDCVDGGWPSGAMDCQKLPAGGSGADWTGITTADCTATGPQIYSCDAATGQCVESRHGTLSAEACIDSCKAPTYSCNAATGQCAADPQGTQTAQGCDATCKAPIYSCNTTAGKCVEDPSGTQTAQSCIGSCKCVAPHNCGQLNGTMQCGAVLAGCNVCDSCCQDYFHQHSCDGCFAAPASEQGCGGK